MSFYVTELTSSQTIDFSYNVFLVDATAGSITMTVPAPPSDGIKFFVKRIDAVQTNSLTILTPGALINGQSSITLSEKANLLVASYSGNWFTVFGSMQYVQGGNIPFSSGQPISLADNGSGSVGIPVFVAFGNSTAGVTNLGSTIDLTGGSGGVAANMAFSSPRIGTITSMTAFFTVTTPLTLPSDGTYVITAALYTSPGPIPNNSFVAISPSVSITLPTISSSLLSIPVGTYVSGSTTNLMVPVSLGDRILLVLSATATGGAQGVQINGFVSAGLSIA
ncbi:MAG: hypothetical protein Terrestrivirus12_4 [Terrestrivirus sp.]|uniref:BclB C-terminal domain-containing protein n=1 Tax=Terrestrivirus sp. TaxID=2487775 RepID=A0A3G4ZRS9_9VIRU|nr:MAG: hypothetical protein Terrestrivirus12_4 [Terrestrivirus sp.]